MNTVQQSDVSERLVDRFAHVIFNRWGELGNPRVELSWGNYATQGIFRNLARAVVDDMLGVEALHVRAMEVQTLTSNICTLFEQEATKHDRSLLL